MSDKRYYAVSTVKFGKRNGFTQSDSLESLKQRLSKRFREKPETEDMAVYDRLKFPADKSRIGTFGKNGYSIFYH